MSQDQATQIERSQLRRRKICGLTMNDCTHLVSSLLLPLVLGISALVVSIQQQESAKKQREQDLVSSELQRQLERNLTDEKYKNELFGTYIKEIGEFLKETNGSLASHEVMATIARAKTLTIFRQVDAQRNIRIIRFLYEAGQITHLQNKSSLDLSTAELQNIDFSYAAINKRKLEKLSLAGAFLTNATFVNVVMQHINLSNAQLDHSDFSLTELDDIHLSFSELDNANFSFSKLRTIHFSSSSLKNADFSFITIMNTNMRASQLQQTNFSFSLLFNIDFSYTQLENANFSHAVLNDVVFSFASLVNVNFSHARLVNVKFIAATLRNVDFSFAECSSADFSNAVIYNGNFYSSVQGDSYCTFILILC